MPCKFTLAIITLLLSLTAFSSVDAQSLEQRLLAEDPADLAIAARQQGDATRGAILFYQQYMACTKCHKSADGQITLGPNLAAAPPQTSDVHLIDAVLRPSKEIRQGYETFTIVTTAGKSLTGFVNKQTPEKVELRDVAQNGNVVSIARDDIDELVPVATSIMPAGQVNQFASRQQFLDLVRYLIEITEGGETRAQQLEPAPALYAARPLPEYESDIDHSGMIDGLNADSFKRGQAIYQRLCINCHGTHDKPGSLPTSLRFANGKFKNGNDPFAMYQTLTRGFGMMVGQAWMVPQQKYDVIHYIREAYLKQHNPSQYFDADSDFLAGLPKGKTHGPAPSNILAWEQMDYGPNLIATYEIGKDASNFAYKGNAIRVDHGPGGVSRGRHWMVFDYDTLRVAAAWSGQGFIDWNGINFNGRHNIHPRIVGDVEFANTTGPGWANPADGSFTDPRLKGRDNRLYGPLPRDWAHYKGMYYHGNDVIISYTVGNTSVLEMPAWQDADGTSLWKRTFNIAPRDKEMILQVARRSGANNTLRLIGNSNPRRVALYGADASIDVPRSKPTTAVRFGGATMLNVVKPQDFDMTRRDFTIVARIKTKKGGTIFAKTPNQPQWGRDGKSLFVRGGRLCYDIGWVGAVQSRRKVDDGKWHDVAITYRHEIGQVQLFIDGKADADGNLKPKQPVKGHVVHLGYTANNFPESQSYFAGELASVRFEQRVLTAAELSNSGATVKKSESLVALWKLTGASGDAVQDGSGRGHVAKVIAGQPQTTKAAGGSLLAGITGNASVQWLGVDGNLRLRIPAGDRPLRFTLWQAQVADEASAASLMAALVIEDPDRDLTTLTRGGPPRWPEAIKVDVSIGKDDGPFAVDVLTHPVTNPWFCRMRLTGFDFYPDGDRAIVSAWDGSVWLVSGLADLPATANAQTSTPAQLTWRRIASGLFQPLGVKIVENQVYVTCRDQICILHDLNGDGEIDYFENFNNDHQVTDHFHEFAMGLQTDRDGNFYYAKSARHALKALVPHHGTLLKVSRDGTKTEIVANGFRAANGVCINPDGTFIVTDQEGHWNPKNRINWVKPGGFYGNMFGYHDVTDASDSAMQQPLCWITNAFDRSPAELLWVDSPRWGALNGSLLNLSYGYGQIYVVPHEEIDGQMQGGMCSLPLPRFPTGIMRGRFHAGDGQLYGCGMFAWAGNQQQPGGFYRIRKTDRPAYLPIGLRAKQNGMQIEFSDPLDPQTASDVKNYTVKTWSLKRTASYGSKHYDEKQLKVVAAHLASDGKSLLLEIPEIEATWCMEIKYLLRDADGNSVRGTIHNTVHQLGE
jgi:putative heme-binding domain-containing protein